MLVAKKLFTGVFETYWCGEKTKYQIVNGSLGQSGLGCNMYGIIAPGKLPFWCGSLAKTKKVLTHWLTKENENA